MSERLNQVMTEIQRLKETLAMKWETKGATDPEILELADKIDQLLNEHDRLLQELAS